VAEGPIGTKIGPYTIAGRLGEGGMGQVFRARHGASGGEVALKLLHDRAIEDPEILKRFRREIALQKRLAHPNLVKVLDAGVEENEPPWLALELVSGTDLVDEIERSAPLAMGPLLAISAQLASGLAYLHAQGIVHRDLKPENVLLTADGEVKISDFGLARTEAGTVITQVGSVVGTVAYMAPEIACGEAATPSSDVYALGLILLEMATGKLAYERKTVQEWVAAICDDPVPRARSLRPEIPDDLDDSIYRMMSKNAKERPAAADVVQRIDRLKATVAPAAKGRSGQVRALSRPVVVPEPAPAAVPPPSAAVLPEQAAPSPRISAAVNAVLASSSAIKRPAPASAGSAVPPWAVGAGVAALVLALAIGGVVSWRAAPERRVRTLLATAGAAPLEKALPLVRELRDTPGVKEAVLARLARLGALEASAGIEAAQAAGIPPETCADALAAIESESLTLDDRTIATMRGRYGVAIAARLLEKLDATKPLAPHLTDFLGTAGTLPAGALERAVGHLAHPDEPTAKVMEELVLRQREHVQIDAAKWRERIAKGPPRVRRVGLELVLARGATDVDAALAASLASAPEVLALMVKHGSRAKPLDAQLVDMLLFGEAELSGSVRALLEKDLQNRLRPECLVAGVFSGDAEDRTASSAAITALTDPELRGRARAALRSVVLRTLLVRTEPQELLEALDLSAPQGGAWLKGAASGDWVLTSRKYGRAADVIQKAADRGALSYRLACLAIERGTDGAIASAHAHLQSKEFLDAVAKDPQAAIEALEHALARAAISPAIEDLLFKTAQLLVAPSLRAQAFRVLADAPFSAAQAKLLMTLDDPPGGEGTWKAIRAWCRRGGDAKEKIRAFALELGGERSKKLMERAAKDEDPAVREIAQPR
jgi:hypothetical protein